MTDHPPAPASRCAIAEPLITEPHPPRSLEGETWRAAVLDGAGIPDLEVSDAGRLRRASTGRIVPHSCNAGYRKARIGHRTARVHRVVAWSFLGAPPVAPLLVGSARRWVVQHVNGDRGDNRLTNLRWMTQAANVVQDLARCPLLRGGGPPFTRADGGGAPSRRIDAGASCRDRGRRRRCAETATRGPLLAGGGPRLCSDAGPNRLLVSIRRARRLHGDRDRVLGEHRSPLAPRAARRSAAEGGCTGTASRLG